MHRVNIRCDLKKKEISRMDKKYPQNFENILICRDLYCLSDDFLCVYWCVCVCSTHARARARTHTHTHISCISRSI